MVTEQEEGERKEAKKQEDGRAFNVSIFIVVAEDFFSSSFFSSLLFFARGHFC